MQRSIVNDIKYNYDHRLADQEEMSFEQYEAYCIAQLAEDLMCRTGHSLEESTETVDNEKNPKEIEYFSDIPRIGSLYLDTVLFMYDDEPIVFICKDKSSQKYLCICDDDISEYSWLITKVSDATIDDIIADRITVLTPFKETEDEVLTVTKQFNEVSYCSCEWCHYSDIDESELPVKDQYLNRGYV